MNPGQPDLAPPTTSCEGSTRGGHPGLTVPELLVAIAVSAFLLLALAGYLRLTDRARSGLSADDQRQALDLAAELLAADLALAGAAPWPPQDTGTMAGLPLTVLTAPAGGHALVVRYASLAAADGSSGAVEVVQHTFEALPDGAGDPQLYRRTGTASRQPLVAHVTRLDVMGGVDTAGQERTLGELDGHRVAALWLRLEAAERETVHLLELPRRPELRYEP